MPGSWAMKLRQLSAKLENGIAAGDRKGNLLLLQREIFPYMAEYVERTHDMGPVSYTHLDVYKRQSRSPRLMARI